MNESDSVSTNGPVTPRNTEASGGSISKIPPDVCLTMLMNCSVGRLAFVGDDGRQQLMPVNFAAVDDEVYFRTSSDGPLAVLAAGRDGVAFGVDKFEDRASQGWNVTVRGTTSAVTDKSTVDKVNAIGLPLPWAGNNRRVLVKLQIQEVDGRRVARY